MFPARFYPPRFYAPRYFVEVGADPAPGTGGDAAPVPIQRCGDIGAPVVGPVQLGGTNWAT